MNELKLFESQYIRSAWNPDEDQWYYSVIDVIAALTDSANPTDYLKKMRKRDTELGSYIGTNCPQVMMETQTGKHRKTLAANTEQLLRIIQSVPLLKPNHSNSGWLRQALIILWIWPMQKNCRKN